MKRTIAALAAGLALGGTTMAVASDSGSTRHILRTGTIGCDYDPGQAAVTCATHDGRGYGIGFSHSLVLVARFDNDGSHHIVFKRFQP